MSITVLVFTDGRKDCISKTIPSFMEAWDFTLKPELIIINDSSSPEYAAWLDNKFPEWKRVHHASRQGFGGAIRSGWSHVETDWVFHLEDDFLFGSSLLCEKIHPRRMIAVLEQSPHMVQLALKRQPVNDVEERAGDLMKVHPESWTQKSAMIEGHEFKWSEQRVFFTTNPSIYRRELTLRGWPETKYSEGVFSHQLLEDSELTFGMVGWPEDGPRVWHIGDTRVGMGY